ncbi:MAG: PSD1 and planctomycete cytochrome C domain-containing protein [Verrucomicrobiales bacterium]|nr:PSD1 and planctomycete cytochrome C domain-containing protein [Verrucomicrobiales bacterium]
MIRSITLLALILISGGPARAEFADAAAALTFFEEKIRPVLAEKCYSCHSAAADKVKGSLQVDHLAHLLAGGDTGPSVVAGDAEASLLVEAMAYENKDLQMPPKERLSPEVVEDFRKWIVAGAPWPEEPVPVAGEENAPEVFDLEKRRSEHWSWRPLAVPAIPEVAAKEWPRSPLDHFILDRLEAAKLVPAAPADDRTWLRRVAFDLTGLPPAPEEIALFLDDTSPDRREKVVDRLLASPHYGEKWARHWMDLVRYAETYGHEFDYPIPYAHEYRDYLIRAFNADLPYDQFAKEHIAGDLIHDPRVNAEEKFNESVLATGFWFLSEATHSPTDVLANEADHMSNQIDVYSKAFLGLTVSCARCHDHKFDAISTADYYALTGYLHGSARTERSIDPGGVRRETAAKQRAMLASANAGFAMPGGVDFGKYLDVATGLVREALAQAPAAGDPWAGIVFEDFEGGYGKWAITGDAFGKAPVTRAIGGQRPITGISGKHFANSFAGKGDASKGSLRSQPFVIEKPFINFHIGGGSHATTALELHVGGKKVRTASGKDVDTLAAANWDVAEFLGQSAELLLVDEHEGGWGHVIVDRIVFADAPAETEGSLPIVDQKSITAVAGSQGFDAAVLARWCDLISRGGDDGKSPGSFLSRSIREAASVKSAAKEVADAAARRDDFLAGSTLYEDFNKDALPRGWSLSGEGFAPTGMKAGFTLTERHFLSLPGKVSSATAGEKHSGVLRSPTFTIASDQIHVRVRAVGGYMRVVMDNYHMAYFQPLLFRGTILKNPDTAGEFQWKSFDADLKKYRGHRAYLEFVDEGPGSLEIDEIRFSDGPALQVEPHPLVALLAPLEEKEWASALNAAASSDPGLLASLGAAGLVPDGVFSSDALKAVAGARALGDTLPPERFALTMAEGTPENAQVYVRGSHRSLGEEVPPRFLEALGGKVGDRLTLAAETVSPDNPLTSRVIVNRLWHHLIGQGLVPSVDDFGPMGQQPSHPELLDWLATDLIANGWSLKHTIRDIVLSETYAQASVANPDIDKTFLATADPTNVLLHRMPVRRLSAEAIRDGILAVSGSLDPALYGSSVPTHRTDFMSGRGARPSGPLDGAARRTIYGAIYRNFLSPFLMTFDMPNPFGPKGNRGASNVPAQALALMNDPFVIDQGKKWADRVLAEAVASDEARIVRMYESATGHLPEPVTAAALAAFLKEQSTTYGTTDSRAWTDLAHALFNSKDFIYVR